MVRSVHTPPPEHERLGEVAAAPALSVYRMLESSPHGLTEAEAEARASAHPESVPRRFSRTGTRLLAAARSPFAALLAALGAVFVVLGDARGAITVGVMVGLSIGLRYWQQNRSERAVAALRANVSTTLTVRRRAEVGHQSLERDVPVADLVTGDLLVLVPGDVLPADVRVLSAHDLVVDQSAISGETLPVRKHENGRAHPVTESPSLCLAGTSVVSGYGTGVVVATGNATYASALASASARARPESSFDRGVRAVGWTLVRFMAVLVPIVLAVNGTVSGNWGQAVMFAVAVAVGLTPEMLPVIVTTNLTRGAVRLSEEQVIVSRLDAIQDLGAMDVLCVDKTGTLTEDRVVYANSVDIRGRTDGAPAEYAYLAVHFQEAPGDRLDEAITEQLADAGDDVLAEATFTPVDELVFDHARRRASVVLRRGDQDLLVCKGDPEEILSRCTEVRRDDDDVVPFDRGERLRATDLARSYAEHGMRVLAVALRSFPAREGRYRADEENELTLLGFVGFVDPVREGAGEAIAALAEHGVAVKVVTGDNEHTAARVARTVGVDPGERVVLGAELDRAEGAALRELVEQATVFAKATPENKTRIVEVLRECGHAVGVMGDGTNDAPALRGADVGIAADTATEVAKRAADLVLLRKDLGVLAKGVVTGRRTLGNTLKYITITASSNFGNVFSVLAASVFLPFLPILPIQLVIANLLYDGAQLSLALDRVDPGYLRAPRRLSAAGIARFMLVFGPLSSLFDLATFAVLHWVFHAGAGEFQTGWFLESLLSQLLVVFALRSAGGSRVSKYVAGAAGIVALLGIALPFSPLAAALSFEPLPLSYAPWLIAVIACYGGAAVLTKRVYLRVRGSLP
ncbi:magnesium-translocating P-type ATPase [Sciscionella sediminilitoris]|uniref:magnesium-translocating P-type ATPase n=1 Tax=Sciscionella sediminilitoris TaxID=1445613 RepID=UPI00055E1AE3|nr:magnesium-translocating P-type ATPase [Sciscionella sp. SE31]